jgi:hypothetical protein
MPFLFQRINAWKEIKLCGMKTTFGLSLALAKIAKFIMKDKIIINNKLTSHLRRANTV